MPRTSKKKATQNQAELLKGLRHIALCQLDTGSETETHCCIQDGWITATNNILSAGVLVPEELNCRPHTHTLLKALSNCKEALTLSLLADRLVVKAGPFRASVPCIPADYEIIRSATPDPICAPASQLLIDALQVCGQFASLTAPQIYMCSICLATDGTAYGTNGYGLAQAYHAISLPMEVCIPKSFQVALSKIDKLVSSVGLSERSFTVYFEDQSWIKTQLMDGQYPQAAKNVLDNVTPENAIDVPTAFFEAAALVASFSKNDTLKLSGSTISAVDAGIGDVATYELPGSEFPSVYLDGVMLETIVSYAEKLDFKQRPNGVCWFGPNIRGILVYRLL